MSIAAKRGGLTKKLRFEVFKRDGFRCQYCGGAAPEVLLVVDHIQPVAEGGKNDILNLITACQPCNAGKGKRTLSDQSVLEKQLDQLTVLNERREQLEMMIKWKAGLSDIKDMAVARVAEHWSKLVNGFSLNEKGKQSLKKLTTQFEVDEIMDAMRAATDQYLRVQEGKYTADSVEEAWAKVAGICRIRRTEKDKPYIRDLLYIRGILRKRVYVNEKTIMGMLEDAHLSGIGTDYLKDLAKSCRNWTEFQTDIHEYMDSLKGEAK
jgi:hypothetical protein